MSRLSRTARQTLTVARRDFTATVFTPIFLLFLFAPIIMGSFGAIGGAGAAAVAGGSVDKSRIVAIVAPDDARLFEAADNRLRDAFRGEEAPPRLMTEPASADPAAQARALISSREFDVAAVLHGDLRAPHILYGPRGDRSADYLALLAQDVLDAQALGVSAATSTAVKIAVRRDVASLGGRNQAAFFAVFGVFFLTLFLSGQVVGTMAEERNNKVIEVLAAAVPLESVFFGKLLGMFGVAVLFVTFWGAVLSQVAALLPPEIQASLGDIGPAVGGGTFALLFGLYFSMAYLLLGSVFLGVGAQASTMREIQMLSLPITILQIAMFALSTAAAAQPGSWLATAAELFPLSSPFAMAAHAANRAELWPHAAALAWQLMWVAIFVTVGARLFRRGVLQSGSARRRWWSRKPAEAG